MTAPDGPTRLRELIDDEIARWHLDHKRGLRPYDLADPHDVADRALRNIAGYGPLDTLLADDDVWEIMINAPDQIFVKRHQGVSGYHDEAFHDDDHVTRTLTKLLDDAAHRGSGNRKLDPAEGLQDAQLDTGARLHIVHADVGREGPTPPSASSSPKRSSRSTSRCPTWPTCRRGHPAPTARRSTSAASSAASCVWRPTSPSSAKSGTEKDYVTDLTDVGVPFALVTAVS